MNLDLGKFKKMKENEHSAVLKHPAGHEIKISKRILSKKMREELGSLAMADGGEVKGYQGGGSVKPYRSPGAEEEALRARDPNFQTDFPQIGGGVSSPVPPTQPTIVINTGKDQSAPQASPTSKNYVSNGNFDWNKYIMEAPDAPTESKINVLKQMNATDQAQVQGQAQAATESNKQALEYNQLAAQRGLPPMPVPEAPQLQQAQVAPQAAPQAMPTQAPPSDPYGTEAYFNAYQKGLGEQKAGIAGGAEAAGKLGEEQAKLLESGVAQQQAKMKSYEDHFAELDSERQGFISDIQNQHVDASKLWDNKSVPQKVSTVIGLILGGIGGGGHGNIVMDMLNKDIERDVEGQKANISKSQNLLAANMHQYGNLKDAVDMTRVMLSDMVSNQLKQSAATAQSPMAQANALKAAGELDLQAAPVLSQIAMRKSITGSMQSGNMDPSQVIRMIVPQGQQETAYKELKEAQEVTRARDNLLSSFEKLDTLNTIGGRVGRPIQTSKEVNAIKDPLIAQLSKATAGRFTEADSKFIGTLFPAPGDDAQTVQTKKIQLKHLVEEKMNFPILKAYGMDLNASGGQSRYGAGGEKKIQLGAPVQP